MSDQYRCQGVTKSGSRCKRRCDNKGFCSHHPASGGKVTKVGFSLIQGVHRSVVSNWLAAGKIEQDDNGHIEWEVADAALKDSRVAGRPLMREGEPHEISVFSDAHRPMAEEGSDENISAEDVHRRYNAARMRKMEEDAGLAEIKRKEAEGELIARSDVEETARTIGIRVRSKMMAIPARVSGDLVSMVDAVEIARILESEIREALTALAEEVADE